MLPLLDLNTASTLWRVFDVCVSKPRSAEEPFHHPFEGGLSFVPQTVHKTYQFLLLKQAFFLREKDFFPPSTHGTYESHES